MLRVLGYKHCKGEFQGHTYENYKVYFAGSPEGGQDPDIVGEPSSIVSFKKDTFESLLQHKVIYVGAEVAQIYYDRFGKAVAVSGK